jgi:hypothetical protein
MGDITFPKMFLNLAQEIGEMRTLFSKQYYKEGTDKHRGGDESTISKLGILGELIARHDLENRNIPFRATKLVGEKPIAEPDILLLRTNIKIDVKGVGYHDPLLKVNEKSHINSNKRPNQYWFIWIDEYELLAKTYLIDSCDVDGWELKRFKYSNAFWKARKDFDTPDVLEHQDWMNR